ncbi:hypothetical protein ACIQTU_10185 [Brevundimonas sp. NPDC090276]|uniref:hypothetical protein n=1 Tax=Brevundimonas sp. NPDC090276 TaxID=3363956 RepID=UPI00383BF4ED
MTDSKIDDAALLVERLLEMGGRTNNKQLKDKLGWQGERYFAARNAARATGVVGLSRGRGGIVFLTDTAKAGLAEVAGAPETEAQQIDAEYAKEVEYYEKLFPTIKQAWVQNEGFDDHVVEITASKRVKGAGRWTVPDIVVIGKIVRQYVPGFEFTVQSIEIKRFESLDALAVFEALNHRRASHLTYLLVVNFPKKPADRDNEKLGQVTQLCEEHDVGLVVVPKGEEGNYDAWEFSVLAADKIEPHPDNLDGFIKQYMSAESKDAVAKMVR